VHRTGFAFNDNRQGLAIDAVTTIVPVGDATTDMMKGEAIAGR